MASKTTIQAFIEIEPLLKKLSNRKGHRKFTRLRRTVGDFPLKAQSLYQKQDLSGNGRIKQARAIRFVYPPCLEHPIRTISKGGGRRPDG
jgi:hypothetical protein